MNESILIYGENFINKDNGYTFYYDAGAGEVAQSCPTYTYLYDQKESTQFVSNYLSDAVTEIIEIAYKNWQGASVERTINRIVLLNTNLKSFKCQYYSGAAWNDIAESIITDNTSTDRVIEITTAVTGTKFRLIMYTTQTANQAKKIGELKICQSVVDLGMCLSEFTYAGVQRSGAYNLSGGSLVHYKEWTKADGTLVLTNVSKTNKDTLHTYLKTASFLTFVMHKTYDVGEIFEYTLTSPPNYVLDRKGEVYEITLELKER